MPFFVKIEVEKIGATIPLKEVDSKILLVKINIITTPVEVVIRIKINIKFKKHLK